MEAHPIADLFPMLAEDELAELADDIKQRGLLQPIVLDADGLVLDGRNRLAACERAEVEPDFVTYHGNDPGGFALTVNINRRHLTKGQKAMIIVRASGYTEYNRGDAEAADVSQQYVSRARQVLSFAPELVDAVVSGKPLNEAYEVALKRKREAAEEQAEIAELRADAPDLADEVTEERLSLADALNILKAREAEAETRNNVLKIDALRDADGAPAPSFAQRVEDGALGWGEALTLAKQWQEERGRAISRAQASIRDTINGWGAVRTVVANPDSPYVRDIVGGLVDSDVEALGRILSSMTGDER